MPQEFQVLRCFSCQTFQVHQVKKAKKWNCKVCGEKQSILKVFGRGTGVECRGHTQKLNRLQGEARDSLDLKHSPHIKESGTFEDDQQSVCTPDLTPEGKTSGRWSHYMEETNGEADDENLRDGTPDFSAFTTDWNQYKTCSKQTKVTRKNKDGKRKAYGESDLEQADLSESHAAGSNCHRSFGKYFNKRSRVSSHKHDNCDQLTDKAKDKVNIAFGGSSGMGSTGEWNKTFGNELKFKTSFHAAVNFKRDQSETYSTNPGQESVNAPMFNDLSSESHSFKQFHDSGHNNEMKISHSKHTVKSTDEFVLNDQSNLYHQSTNEPSHRIQSDSCDFYRTETVNKFGVRSEILNQLESTKDTAFVLNEVNTMSNSTTEMFSRTINKQNVNSDLQNTAFVPKKKTNQQNFEAKKSNSKWGKFLTSPQESGDECSQELEFDQHHDKHCSQTAVSVSHNSSEPHSISDSADTYCQENTICGADSVNGFDVHLSSTWSKEATKCDQFPGRSDLASNVQNLFSLNDSDEENVLTFDL